MEKLNLKDVIDYVETNIEVFHNNRLISLNKLKLKQILKRKNPYLFKAKNIENANDLIKGILDAFLSSQEETLFGNWLEGLAIFINGKVYNGRKSGISGIDLEFENENKRFIVSIKSGPNWGNSSQIKKMITDFDKARKTLLTSNSKLEIVAVNGCCYGIDESSYKQGNYYKYCGKNFWSFISGEENLYLDLIEPIGHNAFVHNTKFKTAYNTVLNLFVVEFVKDFCIKGEINWEKLILFNSGKI